MKSLGHKLFYAVLIAASLWSIRRLSFGLTTIA